MINPHTGDDSSSSATAVATTSDSASFAVLVTGANTGLGFSICCRLLDEFLHTRPQSHRICLTITTRSKSKGDDTVKRLEQYLRKGYSKKGGKFPDISILFQKRIELRQELLDLSSILSVQRLARKLLEDNQTGKGVQRLDALICNAGIGGWAGLNYPLAVWTILTDWVNAVTYPKFKVADVGLVTKAQLATDPSLANPQSQKLEREPPVGEVFCANVFGHYLLGHYLTPLLSAPSPMSRSGGRIVWVSTLEAYHRSLSLDDIQGIKASEAYESSKRLTDVLALTSDLPATARPLTSYTSPSKSLPLPSFSSPQPAPPSERRPRHYVSHPGVCATSIMPFPGILNALVIFAMYIARWLGSPWHTLTSYLGATAPVWLALADQATLDSMEADGGKGKWGSATDLWGNERVERTEVEGWGWGGLIGESKRGRARRRPGIKDTTKEDREEFEEIGRGCWSQMEQLREEWEARLSSAEGPGSV